VRVADGAAARGFPARRVCTWREVGQQMSVAELESTAIADDDRPTRDHPAQGQFVVCGIVVSEAIRWVDDDGAHVVQSTEFDIYGEGEDWGSALADFRGHAFDLYLQIAELALKGEACEQEREVASVLGPRLLEAYQRAYDNFEAAREDRGLLAVLNFGRRRQRQHPKLWRPTTQPNS
jgi:hypothetical protein